MHEKASREPQAKTQHGEVARATGPAGGGVAVQGAGVRSALEAEIAALADKPTDHLRAELARALSLSVSYLSYLAAVWAELERRGEDLSVLKAGIGKYVAAIAAGELLAETVVAFSDRPALLRRAAALPAPEQRKAIERPQLLAPAPAPPRRVPAQNRPVEAARPTLAGLIAMVASCSPGDAAELCVRMIQASAAPAEVAGRLLPEVERIAKAKRRSG